MEFQTEKASQSGSSAFFPLSISSHSFQAHKKDRKMMMFIISHVMSFHYVRCKLASLISFNLVTIVLICLKSFLTFQLVIFEC